MGLKLKKLFLLLLLSSLLTGTAQAVDYTADANCKGAWLFTEGSGTTVDDASANSNTANFKGTGEPAWDATDVNFHTSGSAPNSVHFDGSNDYIDCGQDASLIFATDHALSITAWVNKDGTQTGWPIIAGVRDASNNGYWLELTNSYLQMVTHDAGGYYQARVAHTALTAGTWYFICGRFQTGSNNQDLWINGVKQHQVTGSFDTPTSATYHNFYIGYNRPDGSYFDGLITETSIFDDILTSTEINEIYDYGLKPSSGTPARRRIIIISKYETNHTTDYTSGPADRWGIVPRRKTEAFA